MHTPPILTWYVEEPPNPNLLLLHTSEELTHEMSERYPASLEHNKWHKGLLNIEGIEEVRLHRHHIRLRKQRDALWDNVRFHIQAELTQAPEQWHPVTEEQTTDRKRSYDIPKGMTQPQQRLVYEGVNVAQEQPLAQALFSFPGLLLVVMDKKEIQLKRGVAFTWDDLESHIQDVFAGRIKQT